jgi:hypothetical protein
MRGDHSDVSHPFLQQHLCVVCLDPCQGYHSGTLGILVDKDNVINYQLVISSRRLIKFLTNQPTVDKTIVSSNKC